MAKNYSPEELELLQRVGDILRNHRTRCGMTQERAAELAGINVTYLSDVERGKRNVSLLNLARLAKSYDLELGEVLNEER